MNSIYHIKNSKKWVRLSLSHRLMLTVALTLLVFSLHFFLHDYLQDRMVFLIFLINAQLITLWCGAGMGFLSLITGGLLAFYYFIEPYNSFSMPSDDDTLRLLGYLVVSIFSIVMIEYLQRARYATHLLFMMSQSRYNCLIRLNQYLSHVEKNKSL